MKPETLKKLAAKIAEHGGTFAVDAAQELYKDGSVSDSVQAASIKLAGELGGKAGKKVLEKVAAKTGTSKLATKASALVQKLANPAGGSPLTAEKLAELGEKSGKALATTTAELVTGDKDAADVAKDAASKLVGKGGELAGAKVLKKVSEKAGGKGLVGKTSTLAQKLATPIGGKLPTSEELAKKGAEYGKTFAETGMDVVLGEKDVADAAIDATKGSAAIAAGKAGEHLLSKAGSDKKGVVAKTATLAAKFVTPVGGKPLSSEELAKKGGEHGKNFGKLLGDVAWGDTEAVDAAKEVAGGLAGTAGARAGEGFMAKAGPDKKGVVAKVATLASKLTGKTSAEDKLKTGSEFGSRLGKTGSELAFGDTTPEDVATDAVSGVAGKAGEKVGGKAGGEKGAQLAKTAIKGFIESPEAAGDEVTEPQEHTKEEEHA